MHSFCLIPGPSSKGRAAAALAGQMEQPPALKMRRSNAVQTRRLALRVGLMERHLAAMEGERLREVRQLHQELQHLHVPVRSVTLSPRHAQVLHDAGDDDLLEGAAHDAQGQLSDQRDHRRNHNHQQHECKSLARKEHPKTENVVSDDCVTASVVNDAPRVHPADAPQEAVEGLFLQQPEPQEQRNPPSLVVKLDPSSSSTPAKTDRNPPARSGEAPTPASELFSAQEIDSERDAFKNGHRVLPGDILHIDTTGGRRPSLGPSPGNQPLQSTMKKRGLVRLQHQRRGSGLADPGKTFDLPVHGLSLVPGTARSLTSLTALNAGQAAACEESSSRQDGTAPEDLAASSQQKTEVESASLADHSSPRDETQQGPIIKFCLESPSWSKQTDPKAGRRDHQPCPLVLAPAVGLSTSALPDVLPRQHAHQQKQLQNGCNHFPCLRPDTYHSLGFHPDPAPYPWQGWLMRNARRPHHRLDPYRPPHPLAYVDGRCPTPADTPGYARKKRMGREEVVKRNMASKKEAHAQARPPSWNTNYGQRVPYNRLKYPVRLKPML